jgi:hypothetical protein
MHKLNNDNYVFLTTNLFFLTTKLMCPVIWYISANLALARVYPVTPTMYIYVNNVFIFVLLIY